LADFPTTGGGGSSVAYYLNGSISQGTIGGNAYYEMNKTPVIGTGTDFTINADGYIAQFITDANDPASLLIPAGNWNVEMYFSASSSGGTPSFYVEVYKYNGTTFTLLGSSATTPEGITNGTAIDIYYTSVGIPETVLTITDRLAIRVYVTHSGRTITLHTEDNHLSEIVTTFSNGLTALNGLTKQAQYFAVGSAGTDFNISSSVDTHTFNIPDASATARGLITTGSQTIAGTKTFSVDTVVNGVNIGKGGGNIVSNTANGNAALINNTTGSGNTASGYQALFSNTTGSTNTGNGVQALFSNTTGGNNTANGVQALFNNTIGTSNTASGYNALFSNTTGTSNTANGFNVLFSNTTGGNNTGNGIQALYYNTTGLYNTANGVQAGSANTTGSNNIFLGYNSTGESATESNRTWIGNTDTTSTWVGGNLLLGTRTNATSDKLQLTGSAKITGQLTLGSTITNGTYTYTLPSATGTIALVGGAGVGTVTSVAAITLGTSGTDLSSTVANGTTTPVITLNVPTASASNRGVLSSTDWSTFNSKQGTITLTTTGTSGAATFIANTLNIPNYADGGVLSLSAIGSTPNANAATITGTVLNLQPADASFGGVVTTGTQTFAGAKTFSSDISVNNLTVGRGGGAIVSNTAFGFNALFSNTTGQLNTSIGYNSGYLTNAGAANQTSQTSVYIGADTRASANGNTNEIVIGCNGRGLGSNTTVLGNPLTVFGRFWGNLLVGDSSNSGEALQITGTSKFTGALSGTSATFSLDSTVNGVTVGRGAGNISSNTALGLEAFFSGNTTGTNNTAVGVGALRINTASNSTAVGTNALTVSTTAGSNTGIGSYALQNITTGTNNTAIGVESGRGITTGTGNTILGITSVSLAAGLTNNIILSNGTGAIKAQHDGTNWTFTGAATFAGDVNSNSGFQGRYARVFEASAQRGGLYPYNLIFGSGTDYSIGIFSESQIYMAPGGSATKQFTLSSTGAAVFVGSLSKGSGSFRIEHPLPSLSETHQLVHSFIEGPQADLIYRGKLTLVNGKAQANIDEVSTMTEGTFEVLCREVQCFTTNESGWDLIKGKVIGNIIYIESQNEKSTDEISWMVIGERKDKHMIDTEWTDENGKVIVEPLKPIEPIVPEVTPQTEPESEPIIPTDNNLE
jgi:hypothetical protein